MTLVGGEEGREIATTINTSPRLAPPPIPLKRSFTYPTISSLGQEWNTILYAVHIAIIVSLCFLNLLRDSDTSDRKNGTQTKVLFLRAHSSSMVPTHRTNEESYFLMYLSR